MSEDKLPSIDDEAFLKDRIIFFEGDFNKKNCNILKRKLLYLNTHDENKPIRLYINSYGGSAYQFLMLYGIIKTLKGKLTTVVTGSAMSAGAMLLLLGDERLAYPDSTIMLHELGTGYHYQKLHDVSINHNESKRINNIVIKMIEGRTNIKNVEKCLKEDMYMDVNKAKKLGVIDGVVK